MFDELSVAENIFMGHMPLTRGRLVDWKAMHARAGELMRRALALSRRPEELTSGLKEAENDQDH